MIAQAEHNSEEIEIRDASRSLTEIAKTLSENPQSVVHAEIDGERPLAILAWDDYEALVESPGNLGRPGDCGLAPTRQRPDRSGGRQVV